ncbi:hypothetical protein BGZ83_007407 [Gryganskiella cystojenkinii]|nr:hypothetical protein BGZ83_007407 [Gryganskiella cystojenkinii]
MPKRSRRRRKYDKNKKGLWGRFGQKVKNIFQKPEKPSPLAVMGLIGLSSTGMLVEPDIAPSLDMGDLQGGSRVSSAQSNGSPNHYRHHQEPAMERNEVDILTATREPKSYANLQKIDTDLGHDGERDGDKHHSDNNCNSDNDNDNDDYSNGEQSDQGGSSSERRDWLMSSPRRARAFSKNGPRTVRPRSVAFPLSNSPLLSLNAGSDRPAPETTTASESGVKVTMAKSDSDTTVSVVAPVAGTEIETEIDPIATATAAAVAAAFSANDLRSAGQDGVGSANIINDSLSRFGGDHNSDHHQVEYKPKLEPEHHERSTIPDSYKGEEASSEIRVINRYSFPPFPPAPPAPPTPPLRPHQEPDMAEIFAHQSRLMQSEYDNTLNELTYELCKGLYETCQNHLQAVTRAQDRLRKSCLEHPQYYSNGNGALTTMQGSLIWDQLERGFKLDRGMIQKFQQDIGHLIRQEIGYATMTREDAAREMEDPKLLGGYVLPEMEILQRVVREQQDITLGRQRTAERRVQTENEEEGGFDWGEYLVADDDTSDDDDEDEEKVEDPNSCRAQVERRRRIRATQERIDPEWSAFCWEYNQAPFRSWSHLQRTVDNELDVKRQKYTEAFNQNRIYYTQQEDRRLEALKQAHRPPTVDSLGDSGGPIRPREQLQPKLPQQQEQGSSTYKKSSFVHCTRENNRHGTAAVATVTRSPSSSAYDPLISRAMADNEQDRDVGSESLVESDAYSDELEHDVLRTLDEHDSTTKHGYARLSSSATPKKPRRQRNQCLTKQPRDSMDLNRRFLNKGKGKAVEITKSTDDKEDNTSPVVVVSRDAEESAVRKATAASLASLPGSGSSSSRNGFLSRLIAAPPAPSLPMPPPAWMNLCADYLEDLVEKRSQIQSTSGAVQQLQEQQRQPQRQQQHQYRNFMILYSPAPNASTATGVPITGSSTTMTDVAPENSSNTSLPSSESGASTSTGGRHSPEGDRAMFTPVTPPPPQKNRSQKTLGSNIVYNRFKGGIHHHHHYYDRIAAKRHRQGHNDDNDNDDDDDNDDDTSEEADGDIWSSEESHSKQQKRQKPEHPSGGLLGNDSVINPQDHQRHDTQDGNHKGEEDDDDRRNKNNKNNCRLRDQNRYRHHPLTTPEEARAIVSAVSDLERDKWVQTLHRGEAYLSLEGRQDEIPDLRQKMIDRRRRKMHTIGLVDIDPSEFYLPTQRSTESWTPTPTNAAFDPHQVNKVQNNNNNNSSSNSSNRHVNQQLDEDALPLPETPKQKAYGERKRFVHWLMAAEPDMLNMRRERDRIIQKFHETEVIQEKVKAFVRHRDNRDATAAAATASAAVAALSSRPALRRPSGCSRPIPAGDLHKSQGTTGIAKKCQASRLRVVSNVNLPKGYTNIMNRHTAL